MPKPDNSDRLNLEKIGNLEKYYDDELQTLRERLIEDIASVEREDKMLQERLKALNVRRSELQHERAERSKAIRAVKHEQSQRGRVESVAPPRSALSRSKVARARRD